MFPVLEPLKDTGHKLKYWCLLGKPSGLFALKSTSRQIVQSGQKLIDVAETEVQCILGFGHSWSLTLPFSPRVIMIESGCVCTCVRTRYADLLCVGLKRLALRYYLSNGNKDWHKPKLGHNIFEYWIKKCSMLSNKSTFFYFKWRMRLEFPPHLRLIDCRALIYSPYCPIRVVLLFVVKAFLNVLMRIICLHWD